MQLRGSARKYARAVHLILTTLSTNLGPAESSISRHASSDQLVRRHRPTQAAHPSASSASPSLSCPGTQAALPRTRTFMGARGFTISGRHLHGHVQVHRPPCHARAHLWGLGVSRFQDAIFTVMSRYTGRPATHAHIYGGSGFHDFRTPSSRSCPGTQAALPPMRTFVRARGFTISGRHLHGHVQVHRPPCHPCAHL